METRIILHKKADRRVRSGHPWVFSNEIDKVEGPVDPGSGCRLYAADGGFLGCGYYNPHSLISIRILSRGEADVDSIEFYRQRLSAALAYRRQIYPGLETLRVVYGESDQLPGLVVDKYGQVVSLQLLSCGMDRRREQIMAAIEDVLAPGAVVVRNDAAVRSLEGLPLEVELLSGSLPEPLVIEENNLRFEVDVLGGQKTGGFLDQKENHQALKGRATGLRVLDLFCYSGSWSIHAARYGAAQVTGIDISDRAIDLARRNAILNKLESRCDFLSVDAFAQLRDYANSGQRFGVIVLDPPAFVKSKKKLPEAVRGYLTINRRAMELLEPGGVLLTCSCSHHMGRELFLDTLRQAARKAGRQLRLVEVRGQAQDHPVLLSCPETDYLKCVILEAID